MEVTHVPVLIHVTGVSSRCEPLVVVISICIALMLVSVVTSLVALISPSVVIVVSVVTILVCTTLTPKVLSFVFPTRLSVEPIPLFF